MAKDISKIKKRESAKGHYYVVAIFLLVFVSLLILRKWTTPQTLVDSAPPRRTLAARTPEPVPLNEPIVHEPTRVVTLAKPTPTSKEAPQDNVTRPGAVLSGTSARGGQELTGSKSRLLEIYPAMRGESLYQILGKISVSEFAAKEGSIRNDGVAEDGTTVTEYESTDGAHVTQWTAENGSIGAETIEFSDHEKVSRWFSNQTGAANMVQYDNGPKGGLLYLNGAGDPRAMRVWKSDNDPETRIEF